MPPIWGKNLLSWPFLKCKVCQKLVSFRYFVLKSLVIKKGEKCEKTCLSVSVMESFAADDPVCVELQL